MPMPPATNETPYADLSPETVLDAVESLGLSSDGRLLALASYENRVYQVGLEGAEPIVAKFYRANRWSDEQILEEHAFVEELVDGELPCVPALRFDDRSLHRFENFRFAVFRRQGGYPPNLENEEDLRVLARSIARMHAIGAGRTYRHRPALTAARMGEASRDHLLASGFVPDELTDAYRSTADHLLERIAPRLDGHATERHRLHGDCHLGNVLWRDEVPHWVDFDDSVTGPGIQDLWMLLSGERDEQTRQLGVIVEAYEMFRHFDTRQLELIEPLRTLRIMHHAAWIARRWQDPAFPRAFPYFDTQRYWSEHVLSLREQLAAIEEPPLAV